jgi:hypothetical protein
VGEGQGEFEVESRGHGRRQWWPRCRRRRPGKWRMVEVVFSFSGEKEDFGLLNFSSVLCSCTAAISKLKSILPCHASEFKSQRICSGRAQRHLKKIISNN